MVHYIFQTVAFQLAFLLIYDLLLKKETFFNWNRFYLMFTVLASVILPFVRIENFKEVLPVSLPEIVLGDVSMQSNTPSLSAFMDAKSILSLNYWETILYFGMAVAFLFFIFKLGKIIALTMKSPKTSFGKFKLIHLKNNNAAFSFFHFIFLGASLNEEERQVILRHEIIHVKHGHSIDLLFFEILRIVFWFNPLVYMYHNRMSELHEYIADNETIKYQSKQAYYQRLLSQVFNTHQISFINPFFKQSLIKKRIVMLQKSKSKQINLVKYALLIPMVLGMLVYTASNAQEKVEVIVEEISSDEFNLEVPFAVVDQPPIYPGCENLSPKDQKSCMSENISKTVAQNFNTKLANDLKLTGRQRINVIFKIDTDGSVVGVKSRAAHPDLEKEAIRVVKMLPKMTPGVHKGEQVIVPYSLPIIFEVEQAKKK